MKPLFANPDNYPEYTRTDGNAIEWRQQMPLKVWKKIIAEAASTAMNSDSNVKKLSSLVDAFQEAKWQAKQQRTLTAKFNGLEMAVYQYKDETALTLANGIVEYLSKRDQIVLNITPKPKSIWHFKELIGRRLNAPANADRFAEVANAGNILPYIKEQVAKANETKSQDARRKVLSDLRFTFQNLVSIASYRAEIHQSKTCIDIASAVRALVEPRRHYSFNPT